MTVGSVYFQHCVTFLSLTFSVQIKGTGQISLTVYTANKKKEHPMLTFLVKPQVMGFLKTNYE